ncbi:DUF6037 family protein [Proteus mirabilis]
MPQIVMENLKNLYYDMRSNKLSVQIYNVQLGAISFNVCFSISENPFVLTLTSRTDTPEFFLFNVTNGFRLETFINIDTFKRLQYLLYIGKNSNKLSTKSFFLDLDKKSPTKANLEKIDEREILNLRQDIKYDRERPYFDHWRKHITDGKNVTEDNLAKTLALLGKEAYYFSRNNNNSAIWSHCPVIRN